MERLQKNSVSGIRRYIQDGLTKLVLAESGNIARSIDLSNTNSAGDLGTFEQKSWRNFGV